MKKARKQQTSLQGTWDILVDKVSNFPERIKTAVEEVKEEIEKKSWTLTCIKNGTVDFDCIEEDIQQIHCNLEMKGSRVLGSHVILDDQRNLMKIQTYTEKDGKTYRTVNTAKVQEIRNIPDEVLDELNKKQKVELSFTPD